jgi:hypothetical protein
MRHTRAEVIKRCIREFRLLDRLVAGFKAAEWKKAVPRPETKDPWTVKDALAHITYWKSGVTLSARGERRPPEERTLKLTDRNRLIYLRWRKRPAKEVLAWHRQVQVELLLALRQAPDNWYSRPSREPNWPFDLDGHSSEHRLRDIERALAREKPRASQ